MGTLNLKHYMSLVMPVRPLTGVGWTLVRVKVFGLIQLPHFAHCAPEKVTKDKEN